MATAPRGDQFTIMNETASELILADGALRENHSDSSLFTQFPVGRGAIVSDHKQDAPSLVSVDLFVTDTPVNTPKSQITETFQILSQIVGARSLLSSSDLDTKGPSEFLERGKTVYEALLKASKAGDILTVTTSRRVYSDMVLTRIEVPVESSERGTTISCDFQQIRFADSDTAEIILVTEPRLKSNAKRGNQETTEEDNSAGTAGAADSFLSAIF